MKSACITFIFLILTFSALLSVVRVPFSFGSTGTDYGKDIRFDQDGNIYVTGYFQGTVDFDPSEGMQTMTAAGAITNPGAVDIFVSKHDADGNYLWSFSISTAGADMPHSIFITNDGFLLTGYFGGSADFDPNPNQQYMLNAGTGRDMFIAKYTSAGGFVFAMRAGDIETLPLDADDDRVEDGMDVCADSIGNVYATGVYKGVIDLDPSGGVSEFTSVQDTRDLYLMSLDAFGNFRWGFSIGGVGQDHGHGVRVISTAQIPLPIPVISKTGNQIRIQWESIPQAIEYRIFYSDHPDGDDWNLFQTVNGTLVQFTTDQPHRFYRVIAVLPDTRDSDLVIVTGFFSGSVDFDPSVNSTTLNSAGGWDIFIAGYNAADGAFQWAKRIGGSGNDQSRPGGICVDNQNRILITGDFSGNADFNPDNGTDIHYSNGAGDIFVGAYNADGQYLDAFSIGGSTSDFAHRVTTDSAANILITGQFTSTVDFDPSASAYLLIPNGLVNGDVFVAKYTVNGEFLWANSFGGAVTGTGSFQIGTGVSADANDNVAITGRYYLNPDVDPSQEEHNLASNGSCDCFVVKYDAFGHLLYEPSTSNQDNITPQPMGWKVYPNPFREMIHIKRPQILKSNFSVAIYDVKGRLIANLSEIDDETISWVGKDMQGQPVSNGLYFTIVRLDDNTRLTQKIIRLN
jgi:hypothetical protein